MLYGLFRNLDLDIGNEMRLILQELMWNNTRFEVNIVFPQTPTLLITIEECISERDLLISFILKSLFVITIMKITVLGEGCPPTSGLKHPSFGHSDWLNSNPH